MRQQLNDLAIALRDTYNITTFIETGLFKGDTARWASEHFSKVISIELDPGYIKRAKDEGVKVRIIQGDSAVELPRVIKRLKAPALFWLDAHKIKNHDTPIAECPLIAELEAIRATGVKHLIMIDDARYFVERPPLPHDVTQWPTMDDIKAALPDGYSAIVWQAAILAMPQEAMPVVRRFVEPERMEVTVLTSNAYLHCLPPFAYLFNKFWSVNQAVKVVRYEVRPLNLPTNFTNYAIGKQADYTWSSGLIKYLNGYNGELVVLMLEDYFLSEQAHAVRINQLYAYMQQNPKIAKIDLTNDRLKVAHKPFPDKDFDFIQSAPDAPFQTSLQAAIWRKDFLLRFLNPKENPWQFEKLGTKRVIEAKEDFLILGCKKPPVTYINAIGGEGNNPSAWDTKKIPTDMMFELKQRGLM